MTNNIVKKPSAEVAKAESKTVAVREETPHYGTSTCMEVSKQTFAEIEEIIAASPGFYGRGAFTQGVWPNRRIVLRSIALEASQQFDSKPMRQMKYEFMELFREVEKLRESNADKDIRIAELEAELRGAS